MCQNTHSISLSCPSKCIQQHIRIHPKREALKKKKEVYIAAAAAAGCDAPFAAAESFLCWPPPSKWARLNYIWDWPIRPLLSFDFHGAIQTSIYFFFTPLSTRPSSLSLWTPLWWNQWFWCSFHRCWPILYRPPPILHSSSSPFHFFLSLSLVLLMSLLDLKKKSFISSAPVRQFYCVCRNDFIWKKKNSEASI